MTKEKLLIETLLSSNDIFSRCINIIKPNYFDLPEYRPAVKFITEYFNKYNNVPAFDIVNAEFNLEFQTKIITTDRYNYSCDEIEKFCKQAALIGSIRDIVENHLDKNEFDIIHKKISDAMQVSLQKDLGQDVYDNPEDYLNSLIENEINFSTSIKGLDDNLDGGLAKQTLTLFSANSGVGKSNMLTNLGANYSVNPGFDILYISLELPEKMIRLRMSTVISGYDISLWKYKIPEIANKITRVKNSGAGTYIVKRLPSGTTANGLRSYLRHYETEYKRKPSVIIIDYLDLMQPNGGIKNKGIFEQDKEKSEEVTEILVDYDAIGITASQQNREALRMDNPDQGVIAGGLSKVNTVHNYISMKMDDEMAIRGEMLLHFLKRRSAKKTDKPIILNFNEKNLIITDFKDGNKNPMVRFFDRRKEKEKFSKPINDKIESIVKKKSDKDKFMEQFEDEQVVNNTDLTNLMDNI